MLLPSCLVRLFFTLAIFWISYPTEPELNHPKRVFDGGILHQRNSHFELSAFGDAKPR